MARTRVKICGITNADDALLAVKHGADAIGLVFYDQSPRAVSMHQALEIIKCLPAFISVVGLFVNAEKQAVNAILNQIKLDLLQFHGDETPEYCQSFNQPFIKAVRVNSETNLLQYARQFSKAKGLLLDAFVAGMPGGTGQIFDWTVIPKELPLPVILAGGLNAENVQKAILQVSPYAVDVSGGLEAHKGKKDPIKVAAFMQQVASTNVN